MAARLPKPGHDDGVWGDILNEFLLTSINTDGTLKPGAITDAGVGTAAIIDGSVTTAKIANGNITAAKLANGTITPTKLSTDTAVDGEVLSYNAGNFEWVTPAASGGGGESNTATNIGTAGVGIYKQKTGVQFELKKINAASNKISVTDDTTNNKIDVDVVVANLGLTKTTVGLANVDNTSDASKPVSTAAQTALNAKANAAITITGGTSLTGGGDLSANRTISLVNDASTPGNSKYYGTNGSGSKGYYDVPVGDNDPQVLNVKAYGAVGNNTADDTTAIQAALDACVQGGTVLLPVGQYRISASLKIPPYVTLQGSYGMRGQATLTNIASRIKPFSAFTGAAAIVLLDKEQGGYSTDNEGAIIKDLTLDGSALGATVISGIKATGLVHGVRLENINLSYFTDRGLFTTTYTRLDASVRTPYSWYIDNVHAWATGSDGFRLSGLTDTIVNNCRAIGTGRHGFYADGMANSTFTNCRAEWADQYGFWLPGSWGTNQGSGGAIFTNITTDRNNFDGIRIEATGSSALIFDNLMLRRDGRNNGSGEGSYAGLRILNATSPIHVNNLVVYPGTDDTGAGTNSPQCGFVATNSLYINIVSGFIHAATTAWTDGGSNTNLIRGNKITERVGTTASFTTTVPPDPTSGGGSSTTVVSRKPNVPPYRGNPAYVQNFATGHGWTSTGFGGTTNLNQTTTGSRSGSQQVSLVTDAAGGVGSFKGTGQTSVDLSADTNHVTVWLKTSNQQQIGSLTLRVADTGGLSANRYGEWTMCASGVTTILGANQQAITNGNVLTAVQLSPADLALTGAPDLSAITEWEFTLADRNNGQGAQTVAINSIEVMPTGISRLGNNGVLALTFDDGYAGAATYGRQVLGRFGYQATFFPIVDALGSSSTFMTATQLKQLSVDGHEIGVHSYAKTVHDNYATTTATDIDTDARLAAQWMADNGYSGETMAYPQGSFYPYDANVQKVYAAGRTTLGIFKHTPTPILNPWRLRSISQVGGVGGYATTNLTQAGGVLEKASTANSVVTLTFHNVTQGAATAALECSMADLAAICQKAKDLNMTVATLGQIIHAQN